jgi:uncharacterized membrane protein YgcG
MDTEPPVLASEVTLDKLQTVVQNASSAPTVNSAKLVSSRSALTHAQEPVDQMVNVRWSTIIPSAVVLEATAVILSSTASRTLKLSHLRKDPMYLAFLLLADLMPYAERWADTRPAHAK